MDLTQPDGPEMQANVAIVAVFGSRRAPGLTDHVSNVSRTTASQAALPDIIRWQTSSNPRQTGIRIKSCLRLLRTCCAISVSSSSIVFDKAAFPEVASCTRSVNCLICFKAHLTSQSQGSNARSNLRANAFVIFGAEVEPTPGLGQGRDTVDRVSSPEKEEYLGLFCAEPLTVELLPPTQVEAEVSEGACLILLVESAIVA